MAKRIKPILIPDKVTVEHKDNFIKVSGPLGSLDLKVHPSVTVKIEGKSITVLSNQTEGKVHVGTTMAHIKNMIKGVTEGFEKALEVRGTGYRAQKTKDGLQVFVGFIHPVNFAIPKGINVELKQAPNPDDPKEQMTEIYIKGVDKQAVGEFAAKIRATKPPDVYKGKGIRYKGEYIRKKAGKRAVAAQA